MYKVAFYGGFDNREFVTPDMAHHTARDLSRKDSSQEYVAAKVIKKGDSFGVEDCIGYYKNGMRIDE
jgi:hypothetical protein